MLQATNLGVESESREEIALEYWRGTTWIGATRLNPEESELRLSLTPDWSYLLRIGNVKPFLLRIACAAVSFSPTELRMGTLLRVLAGDVSGGYELLRKQPLSLTGPFRWVMATLSQCLPEPALEVEYAAVRDASSQSEIESDLRSLLFALAAGWLGMPDAERESEKVLSSLEASGTQESKAFLESLKGEYREALDLWASPSGEASDNPYVAAGRHVVGLLVSDPGGLSEETPPIGRKDLDTLLGCVRVLGQYEGPGEEDINLLADALSSACR